MKIRFEVEVEVKKASGKFCSKDDVANAILEQLEGSDPGSITVDDTEYEVESFQVVQL